jgi:hypothetical protein
MAYRLEATRYRGSSLSVRYQSRSVMKDEPMDYMTSINLFYNETPAVRAHYLLDDWKTTVSVALVPLIPVLTASSMATSRIKNPYQPLAIRMVAKCHKEWASMIR